MRSGPSSPSKEANCDRSDPADAHKGDYWDHVALDAEHRLVVSVVPGARTVEGTEALVADARDRTGGRLLNLMTSDDYPAYETAILHAYGETVIPPAGPPQGPLPGPAFGPELRRGDQAAGGGAGRGGRHEGGLRDGGGGDDGAGPVEGQPVDQHGVHRA